MEALQMYKFALKKDSLDFMSGVSTSEEISSEPSSDLLQKLAGSYMTDEEREDVMDKVLKVIK